MRNERGVTLIELLAALTIVGIVFTLIGSVFISGLKASDKSATNQRLQQEANYITEAIRNEYLKRPDAEDVANPILTLEISDNCLAMDGEILSEGYVYHFKTDEATEPVTVLEINRSENIFEFNLGLEKNDQSYEVKTTLSKLK